MAEQLEINPAYVEQCRLRGFRWNEIAAGLFVSRRVLERWRARVHFVDPIVKIPDTVSGNELIDSLVSSYLQDTGRRGEVFTKFYIQTLGYYIPRRRLRDAIWRVDPAGRYDRRPGPRIPRVVYDVEGPMHLVHIDGSSIIYPCISLVKYTRNMLGHSLTTLYYLL